MIIIGSVLEGRNVADSLWIKVEEVATETGSAIVLNPPEGERISLHKDCVRVTDKFNFSQLCDGEHFELHVSKEWLEVNSLI